MDNIRIDITGAQIVQECMEMTKRIYNHPNTNKHTKDFIRFELQRILGREYDIKEYLKSSD